MSASDSVVVDPATQAAAAPARACENCGAALLGEHCYSCGQPTKGLIRQFSDILGDFFDTVLNIDARIFRTVGPLIAHPGRLSLEYFAGHRVRYVSPVRLFVFLSIATFLIARMVAPDLKVDNHGGGFQVNVAGDSSGLQGATTVAEVEKRRDVALAKLDEAITKGGDVPGLKEGLQASQKAIRDQADARIRQLKAGEPSADGDDSVPGPSDLPGPPGAEGSDNDFNFNGKPWDEKTNPVVVGWLPAAGNHSLNRMVGRAKANAKRIQNDPNAFKNAVLGAMPTALFLLLPIFALLLKLAYVFKRRLYMEHLIVALHSHAFLCVATLILIALSEFQSLLGGGGFLHGLANWASAGVWIWMPTYLLIMQKRIYGQGWIMTLMKFFSLGLVYVVLLSLGLAATMLATLVWM